MKIIASVLILFGIIIILAPAILAYLIGGFFIFLGANLLFLFWPGAKQADDSYVKFGNYKIYRGDKK